ncbi:MAG: lipopolysaccharide biosynthesis protein [Candidatus Binatia bacterium]
MKAENILLKHTALPEINLRRRVLDGVFWMILVKVFGQVISWTITIYVVRILSPNDYGLMAMAGVYLSFVMLFNEVGLGSAIIQKKDLTQEDLSNICWAIIFINVVLYVLSVLSAPLIAAFFNEPRVTDVIRVASIIFIIHSLGLVSYHMLTRDMIFNRRSQAEMIGNLSGAVSTLWLATHGFGVWSLVWGTIIVEATRNLLFFVFYPWKLDFAFSFSKIKGMTQFGSKVALARFFWYLYSNMDLLIAGKILGKTQLGFYSIAVQFSTIPLDKVVSTISQVAFPVFSAVQDDHALLRRYFLTIVKFVAFVSFPAFLGIFVIAESAVPLFLSTKWMPAILPLQILCMVATFRAINTMNAPLVLAIGRPEILMFNNLIMAVVLALSFFIGSDYGLTGFAYAWLVFPAVFLITTSISLNLVGLPLVQYFKELRHPFLGTGFMVMLVLPVQKIVLADLGLVVHVAASAALGVAFYLLYYLIFNREMFAEAREILKR